MNALILGILATFSFGTTDEPEDFSWVINEMNNHIEYVSEDIDIAENHISIFDLDGNLVNEYHQEDVVQNELNLTEIDEVRESDFLFEYQGTSYYLE